MNAVITADVPGASLVPASLGEAVRFAEVMAQGRLVPKHLQGSPGDCLMVIEQAARWRMSPFAVAQATSVISGKMMFEGKLVAAAVETSGAIVGHLDYTFAGEGETRSITVSATRRGETQPRSVTVTLKEARTANEMWKRQPDQQLVYHGARVWARRWTPAVILGVYSHEEMGPIIEGEVTEAAEAAKPDRRAEINREVPMAAAAATAPEAPFKRQTLKEWLAQFKADTEAAQTPEEASKVLDAAMVMDEFLSTRPAARAQYEAIRDACIKRVWAEPPPDDDLPEVEINGMEKVGAG